jgi:hypothetical protein
VLERGPGRVGRKTAPSRDERVLGDVLDVLAPPEEPTGEPEHASFVRSNELGEGGLIPLATRRHEGGLFRFEELESAPRPAVTWICGIRPLNQTRRSVSSPAFGRISVIGGAVIDPDERQPYTVEPEESRFRVLDWEGNVILVCADSQSAEQYAVLMNQAFRCGFSAGHRKGRLP